MYTLCLEILFQPRLVAMRQPSVSAVLGPAEQVRDIQHQDLLRLMLKSLKVKVEFHLHVAGESM